MLGCLYFSSFLPLSLIYVVTLYSRRMWIILRIVPKTLGNFISHLFVITIFWEEFNNSSNCLSETSTCVCVCVCVCVCMCVCVWVTQSCPSLCDPIDCSLPNSSAHGSLQARLLEWVVISSSRVYSQPRDQTWVSALWADSFFFFFFFHFPLTDVLVN